MWLISYSVLQARSLARVDNHTYADTAACSLPHVMRNVLYRSGKANKYIIFFILLCGTTVPLFVCF
jgi:hypothetical protein